MVLQFTGLSGAGKTTLAHQTTDRLINTGLNAVVIDGDVMRKTVCRDLGFSKADRIENIRRLGKISAGYKDCIVIIAAINPYEKARRELKLKYNARTIWLKCNLNTLLERDTKGLYRRAYLSDTDPSKVHNLTGVNDAFEVPGEPDLILNTDIQTLEECTFALYQFIVDELKPSGC